jgi:hypothetical protein
MKGFIVRTPPMIPVSIPKSIPPKHAYNSSISEYGGYCRTTDRTGKHIHSPPIDFLGILSYRLIVDELSEEGRHVDDDSRLVSRGKELTSEKSI